MRSLVIIPTFNEREALPVQLAAVRAATPDVDILVADDNSPDGTGAWADAVAAEDPHVHVLHRPGKAGLGAAYIAGFAWGIERGYDTIVEMDADGSHRAIDLAALLERVDSADLVIVIDRPLFTYTYTFTVISARTRTIVASGKLLAFDGNIAAPKLAKAFVEKVKAVRPFQEEGKR